eukprot:583362-Pleurochrysis_carterae.AAC.1
MAMMMVIPSFPTFATNMPEAHGSTCCVAETELINSRLRVAPYQALRSTVTIGEIGLKIKGCSLCNSNSKLRLDLEMNVPNFRVAGMRTPGSAKAVLPVVLTQHSSGECEQIIVNLKSDELEISVDNWIGRVMRMGSVLRVLGDAIITLFRPTVLLSSHHCTR